ncbi:MAG: transposase [Nitrospiraceae bacterium]
MAWEQRRPAPGLVHHSDQGNQYRAGLYQTVLTRRGVVLSMSRKGNCYDNASVESFFSSLKNELVRHRQFAYQAEARYAIAEFIERFYNCQRLHQALGYRSSEELEKMAGESESRCPLFPVFPGHLILTLVLVPWHSRCVVSCATR